MAITLNLKAAEPLFHQRAIEAVEEGSAGGFLFCAAGNHNALTLVLDNVFALKDRGIYEKCLVDAFTSVRTNHSHWPQDMIDFMFSETDPQKLRDAGDPIPPTPVTIYRGVSGKGRARRISGYSWTDQLDVACWFALRMALPDPAIYVATVGVDEILCFDKGRKESEYLARPRSKSRLSIPLDEMKTRSDRLVANRMKGGE